MLKFIWYVGHMHDIANKRNWEFNQKALWNVSKDRIGLDRLTSSKLDHNHGGHVNVPWRIILMLDPMLFEKPVVRPNLVFFKRLALKLDSYY